jgi:SnoaL-like domain
VCHCGVNIVVPRKVVIRTDMTRRLALKESGVSEVLTLLEVERAIHKAVQMMYRAFDDGDWKTLRTCLSTEFSTSVSADRSVASSDASVASADSIRGADMMVAMMKDLAAQWQAEGVKVMHLPANTIVTVSGHAAEVSTFQTAYRYRATEVSCPVSESAARQTFRLRREGEDWKIISFDTVRLWLVGEPY